MLVKPAPGLVVRDPRTKLLLPEEGLEVSADDLDFNRLLRDGDVVLGGSGAAAPDSTAVKPSPPTTTVAQPKEPT